MNFRDLEPRLLKEFTLYNVLGSGAYGVVLQAIHFQDKKSYAIKVVAGDIQLSRREVDNLLKIPSHPNVVHYHTCWEDEFTLANLTLIKQKLKISINDDTFRVPIGAQKLKVLCIQMELCGQDLRSWIGKQRNVDEEQVTKMFLQIATGLEHIHKHKIIHRDLKPDNIFLGKNDPTIVKIGDLGIATEHLTTKSAAHTRRMGTPLYLAPEQGSSRYGRPADLYALGLILFEMLNPKLQPAANSGSYETLFKGFIDLKYKNVLPTSIATQWPKMSELILKMIKVSPEDRPSFQEIFDTFKTSDAINHKPNVELPPIKKIDLNAADAKPEVKPALKKDINFVPKLPVLPVTEICGACYKPIIKGGKVTTALGKKWHPEHFKCYRCFIVLDDFFEKDGKPYCGKDFHRLFAPKCAKCLEPIAGTVTKALGKTWHPEHAPKEVNPGPTEDIAFQPKEVIKELCAGCYTPIENGKGKTALGKNWHAEHFKCCRCFTVLDAFFEKDGKAYCDKDYLRLFAPKCDYCHEPISGTVTKAMGKTWHPEHAPEEVNPGPAKDIAFEPKKAIQELCPGCYKPIESGKGKTALGRKWHAEHFKCYRCFIVLDAFFEKHGKPYCEKDFNRLFAPKCAYCNEPITGTVTKAMGNTWHPEHVPKGVTPSDPMKDIIAFEPKKAIQDLCAGCYKPIDGGKITTAMGKKWHSEHFKCNRCSTELVAYFEKDGKAYCDKDYHDLFSPKCAHCNQPIIGIVTKALGKIWHPEHLPDEIKNGPTKDIAFAPKGSVKEICGGCNKLIDGGQITTAMGKKWHSDHFKCNRCSKVLDEFFEKDGKAYCEKDYLENFAPKCAHCHKAISGSVTRAMGKTWHPEHFVCARCRKPLDGPSYLTKDEKPYCQEDYFDLFAPRCSGCKQVIIDAQYTSTEDPIADWHPHCFVCAECKEPLTKYHTRGNNFYCSIHKL